MAMKTSPLFLTVLLSAVILSLMPSVTKSASCTVKANEEVMECEKDFKDRMDDGISERKECCAFVKFRHCVRDAFEDECDDHEDIAIQEYQKWRNASEWKYPKLALRCRDDSHDSFECTFLNHMGVWITLFTFMLILTCVALAACFWAIIKSSGTAKSMFSVN